MKKLLTLSLVASSLVLADTDLSQLQQQMDKQQLVIDKLLQKIEKLENNSGYEKQVKIDVLEEKISQKKQEPKVKKEYVPQTKGKTFYQASFMPDISLIADMSYVHRDVKDDAVAHLEVPGVAHGLLGTHEHEGNTHAPYNAKNGFNLNYAELGLSKAVDPKLHLTGIFHFSEDSVEIEELYFTTTALGYGTRIKGGKFNSNFGYLNEQHHHYWSFADMPLVYESFLGMHGINENGVQLQWTAPTSNYLMFGAEILQGDNEQMFGNSSIGDPEDPTAASESAPSLFIAYAKSSIDIEDTTILGGISYANGSSRIDHSSDEEGPHAFAGDSELYGVDLVVKNYFDSYSSLMWQNEVLYRKMDGIQYNFNSAGAIASKPNLVKKQAGLYSQLVYTVNKSWKTGIRYDSIFKNDVIANGVNKNMPTNLYKHTGMIEYNTSEFARFRLQYNHNSALHNEDGHKQDVNSIIFQVNLAIGAHGAHSF